MLLYACTKHNYHIFGDGGKVLIMATHGAVGPFNADREDWSSYIERLQQYFIANKVKEDKLRAILLSVSGAPTYKVIRNLAAPRKPTAFTFGELVEFVQSYYSPAPSTIVQHYNINTRVQKEGESVVEFVAELKKLLEHCQFNATLEDMLRDRLVCGIRDSRTQERLLSEPDLSFKKAYDICMATEMAEKNARDLQPKSQARSPTQAVLAVNLSKSQRGGSLKCFRCNSTQHLAPKCPHKSTDCHHYGKKGHLARACCSAKKQKAPHNPRKTKFSQSQQTHHLGESGGEEEEQDTSYMLCNVSSPRNPPLRTTVILNGREVVMEVDTGAAVSVISEETYRQTWKNNPPALQPSAAKLKTYTGETLTVLGTINVLTQYAGQEEQLDLLVVDGSGPTLLGMNWLSKIHLGWQKIAKLSCEGKSDLEDVLQKHGPIFREELGLVKGVTARLQVESEATPIFFKAHTMPYALRGKIEQELQRLEKQGVLEKVEFAEWAAPIVPVTKPDGSVRICGDYKVTVNKVAKLDTYPLPRIEDLFASLAGGKQFTKLDLAHAYQQIPLEEESKQYVVINTLRGLYKYNRLPFGVASAPAIFQKTMDNLLQGLKKVTVYIDDILVTGSTQEEHLKNLEEVLTRLQRAGIQLKRSKCAFMLPSVEYLGHIISTEGLHPTAENYYSRFLSNLSSVLAPLYQLLQKNKSWSWGKTQSQAFQEAKEAIASSKVLTHYDPELPLILECDASPYGVGAVLSHKMKDGLVRPIAFTSRSLTQAEKNYAQLDKEGLAIIVGIKRFHQYIYGRNFTIYSDHKPLQHIFNETKPIPTMASARIQRWGLILNAYNYTIVYKPGSYIPNADLLS